MHYDVKISCARIPTHDLWIRNRVGYPLQPIAHTHALKCLFVNVRGLVSKTEDLKQNVSEMKIDIMWCKIKIDNNSSIAIGVCYRSQVASEQELQELFKVISIASKGKVLIMGDFNYPRPNWDTYECDSNAEKFSDLLLDNYLCQLVREPTRKSNILDLVISSDENMVTEVELLEFI